MEYGFDILGVAPKQTGRKIAALFAEKGRDGMGVEVEWEEQNKRWTVELDGVPCGDFVDTDDDGRAFCDTPSCLLLLEEDGTPAQDDDWFYPPAEPSIFIEAMGKSGATCVRLSDLKAAIEQFETHIYKKTVKER